MSFVGPNNSLAWAQFRLRGGWKRSLGFAIGACILLATLIAAHARIGETYSPRIFYGWSAGLMILQAGTLVLYASGRIGAGIRLDVQTKLIESHRLMPTPPLHAIAGYIAGNVLQPLVFFAGIFIIGMLTTARAGMNVERWVFSNAILLGFCVFVWVFMAYASFGVRLGPTLIFLPVIIPYASEGGGLSLLPAVSLLVSPIAGTSIFDLRGDVNWTSPVYAMSFASQLYFAVILFLAAARRYRAANAVGLNTILTLCLMLGWCAISCVALRVWSDLAPRGWRVVDFDSEAQVLASMVFGLILALGAVSSVARDHAQWRRHQRSRDPAPMSRPIPAIIIIIAAALGLLSIAYAPPDAPMPAKSMVIVTLVSVAAALTSMYFLYHTLYRAELSAGLFAFIWIVVAWVGPIAVDLFRHGISEDEIEPLGVFAASSPIGALVAGWLNYPVDVKYSVIGQLALGSIPVIIFAIYATRQRAR